MLKGFKGLIFKDESGEETQKETTKETSKTTKFPKVESTQEPSENIFKKTFSFGETKSFTPAMDKGEVSPEHLTKAIERYQKGFESLNQPGFDFYEFYHLVIDAGVENSAAFTMALKMAKTMDKSIDKETLISQAQFYETEINKSYQDSITNGNAKKQELLSQKEIENQALVQELGYMKEQLENMKAQIQERENKLNLIGSKYQPQINEIDSKLGANDMAKNQLIKSIEQVKNGININLK